MIKRSYYNYDEMREFILNLSKVFYALDTTTLTEIYTNIYKELIQRKDFAKLDDCKMIYHVVKQRLIEEGYYNV